LTSSRRDFLRSLGVGTVAGAALRWPVAGIPAASAAAPEAAMPPDRFIFLDSNENAYGPSARVAEAVRSSIGLVNRYPFRKYDGVTERIAKFHQVKAEQVLFGCGSSEILRLAACAFPGDGRQLIQAWPTFESIQNYAKSVGSEVLSVPLAEGFVHDVERMLARVKPSTGLVYVCNPNNPTATVTPRKDLDSFIGRLPATTKVLIDEAYHHFTERSDAYASFIDRPLDDDRVIVTRTFSKVYGLAGLRLGYAIAAPKVIEKMRAFLTQDSLNAIVAEVVSTALDDTEGVKKAVQRNRDDRQEFRNSAMLRMIMPVDSHANFAMMDTQHSADEVIEHFKKHKILIGRHFPPMDTYIRVSLGTPAEMQSFWQVWDMLPWAKKFMHH
jgi:histidinol-phosphate aminotransferase